MKRPAVQIETPAQRYGVPSLLQDIILRGVLTPVPSFQKKSARRTIPGEAANRASTSQAPRPDSEAGMNTRRALGAPPTEDADKLSATHSDVESAMNHRRRRTVTMGMI